MVITYVLLAVYFLALIGIGFFDSETENAEGFVIANIKCNLLVVLDFGS